MIMRIMRIMKDLTRKPRSRNRQGSLLKKEKEREKKKARRVMRIWMMRT